MEKQTEKWAVKKAFLIKWVEFDWGSKVFI